jgi:hypothetical protein
MKRSINKEMVEKMKRRVSLKSKLGGNQLAPKLNVRTKREKMLYDKGKIIFLEMKKFQQWIVRRNVEWAWNTNGFGLLNM